MISFAKLILKRILLRSGDVSFMHPPALPSFERFDAHSEPDIIIEVSMCLAEKCDLSPSGKNVTDHRPIAGIFAQIEIIRGHIPSVSGSSGY